MAPLTGELSAPGPEPVAEEPAPATDQPGGEPAAPATDQPGGEPAASAMDLPGDEPAALDPGPIPEAPAADQTAEEPAIAPPEAAAPPELPPEPVNAPPLVPDDAEHIPIDPPEAMEPPPVVELGYEQDPGAEQAPSREAVEEHAAEHPSPAAAFQEPVAEPQAEHVLPAEAFQEPVAEPPADALADTSEEAVLEPSSAEAVAQGARRRERPDGGYPIPGLPEEPAVEAPGPLPEPPARLRGPEPTPMRRAFRRTAAASEAGGGRGSGGGSDAAGFASDGRSRRPRRMRSRWFALLALLVVGVIVAAIVYSLTRSSHTATVTAPPVVKVLIPEGKTRLQIAQLASKSGLTGSYRRAARSSPLLNPVSYGAPHDTPDLEGFLFPATYDMNKHAPASRLVEAQLTAFQENFNGEYAKRAKALGLTPYELLTVASMIEREAKVPSDRAKIAAVIYNRLRAGIPLGIDATIYYAVESAKNVPTYTKELTTSQLQTDSPYNTRTRKGLPPTPISNPGVASIQAAAHPAHVSYLYYVAGADGCGEMRFATSEAKFQEDVAAYEAAKGANGGQLPACKHG